MSAAGAALCGVSAWWQGNYSQPWANGAALPRARYATGGGPLSTSSRGRAVRANNAGFLQRNDSSWVQGPPPAGEGAAGEGARGGALGGGGAKAADALTFGSEGGHSRRQRGGGAWPPSPASSR